MDTAKRPVVFWASKKRPSSVMRGIQVAEALGRRGFQTQVRFGLSPIALRGVRDSIIVCVKSRPRFSGWLKRNGNRLVHDAIDFTPLRGVAKDADAVITGSDFMRDLVRKRLGSAPLVRTIYHHADPLLQPHVAGERELHLAYVGERNESRFLSGEIPELNVVSFKERRDWRHEIRNYNAHFSARVDPYKSVIKLANVAALGGVFLAGAEPGIVELLGREYPFLLRDPEALRSVREDVLGLKDAVGTERWRDARARIERARGELTIEATARAYEALFEDLR